MFTEIQLPQSNTNDILMDRHINNNSQVGYIPPTHTQCMTDN